MKKRLIVKVCTIVTNLIFFLGKTNKGRILYSRSTRHKDVRLCSIRSLAFYLGLRFDISKEFKNFPLENWLNNNAWFDIKLLADAYGDDFVSPLPNDTYSRSIRQVLLELGLPVSKIKHLGRGLGPKILESLENEQEGIRQLYKANGIYHNPRCVLKVEDTALLEATPFAPFIDAYAFVKEQVANAPEAGEVPRWTALQFLEFMVQLNHIFLQDAAAILVLHPERAVHPIFKLECFHIPEFQVSECGVFF